MDYVSIAGVVMTCLVPLIGAIIHNLNKISKLEGLCVRQEQHIDFLDKTINQLVTQIANINSKVEVIWSFQLRRGVLQGLSNEMFTQNSPLKLTPKTKEIFKKIEPELKQFYNSLLFGELGLASIDDKKLTLIIEEKFGDRIVNEICKVYGIQSSECIIAAAAIAKGTDQICDSISSLVKPTVQEITK